MFSELPIETSFKSSRPPKTHNIGDIIDLGWMGKGLVVSFYPNDMVRILFRKNQDLYSEIPAHE